MTRPEVRKLLDSVLRTDADLDVFVGDYCNEVYRFFTDGMHRPAKVSLLLDKASIPTSTSSSSTSPPSSPS